MARCGYEGSYHPLVRRSALTLKLLTYSPTGAIVAAPATSLPEEIGGVRNWDYRYTWLRDSALMLYALQGIGYHAEAADFFGWLERLCVRCNGDRFQIMYTVRGEEELPEQVLGHLDGYRGSRPVRIGNAAAGQTQLDIFGEVLDAAALHFQGPHRVMEPAEWDLQRDLADRAARRWREPDQGIWEVRGGPRHFLYSKLLCWVALDRALRLAAARRLPAGLDHWRRTRAEIRRVIETDGYDREVGAFTQALGERALDASALALPLVGFLPPTDARVRSTVARIQEQLTANGLVYRYRVKHTDDGLPGDEATFALCSFWAAEHAPREMLVGRPTAQAVWGQKLIPGLLDRYLAKAGWAPQFVDRPNNQQGDILFETLPGDPGAHGPYRDRERGPDLQMRLRMRPRATAAGLGLVALGALVLLRR